MVRRQSLHGVSVLLCGAYIRLQLLVPGFPINRHQDCAGWGAGRIHSRGGTLDYESIDAFPATDADAALWTVIAIDQAWWMYGHHRLSALFVR